MTGYIKDPEPGEVVHKDLEHLAKEKAKWYWKRYAIRKNLDHWAKASWYKYKPGPDGRRMTRRQRASYVKSLMQREPETFSAEELTESKQQYEKALQISLLHRGPSIPDYPVLDWWAKSVFRWYYLALWTVDLDHPDWLNQLRAADQHNTFSYAECEAYAARAGLEIGPVERLFLRYVTREGVMRPVRRIIWEKGSPTPPYILEGFHNPSLIMSAELRKSLAMTDDEVRARRHPVRDKQGKLLVRRLPSRKKFTPSGSIKQRFLRRKS